MKSSTRALLCVAVTAAILAWGGRARSDLAVWCHLGDPGRPAEVGFGERVPARPAAHSPAPWRWKARVRVTNSCPPALRVARSGSRYFFLRGSSPIDAGTELVRMERDEDGVFVETGSLLLEDGHDGVAASLDADGDHVAIATFEERAPILTPPPRVGRVPDKGYMPMPSHVLHVRVVDPRSLMIVAARVMRGDHYFLPHPVADLAGHVLAFAGGELAVALPDDPPRVAFLRISSLATLRERTISLPSTAPAHPFTSTGLANVDGRVVPTLAPWIDQPPGDN